MASLFCPSAQGDQRLYEAVLGDSVESAKTSHPPIESFRSEIGYGVPGKRLHQHLTMSSAVLNIKLRKAGLNPRPNKLLRKRRKRNSTYTRLMMPQEELNGFLQCGFSKKAHRLRMFRHGHMQCVRRRQNFPGST